jgi:hypothetical protein
MTENQSKWSGPETTDQCPVSVCGSDDQRRAAQAEEIATAAINAVDPYGRGFDYADVLNRMDQARQIIGRRMAEGARGGANRGG